MSVSKIPESHSVRSKVAFPEDILLHVSDSLDLGSLARMTSVCRSWRDMINQTVWTKGEIEVYFGSLCIYNFNEEHTLHDWGRGEEAFAEVRVYSYRPTKTDEDAWYRHNWTLQPFAFPCYIPLRFFINGDGSYKNSDDKVKLIWKGKPLALRCIPSIGRTFSEEISKRADLSLLYPPSRWVSYPGRVRPS